MPRSSVIVAAAESKGFSPADIAGLALWLDASDESTITASSGAVSQWDDKSGNGNHVTQGTAVSQPGTSIDTVNGKNVLTFDGGDWLDSDLSPNLSQPFTTFAVFQFDNLIETFQYVLDSGVGDQNLLSTSSQTTLRVFAGSADSVASGLSTSTTYIADWVANGASSEAKLNGASSGTISIGTNGRQGVTVGAAQAESTWMTGVVAEVLEYSGALSDAGRLAVREYLAAKWGVTL